MRIFAQIVLFVFIAFLFMPTIVCVLEESDDITIISDFSEDEKEVKDIKVIFYSEIVFQTITLKETATSLIISENLSKHDAFIYPLYATPPDLS